MTEAISSNYWISPSALYISLNALGSPDYIQASVASGSYILCYFKTDDTQLKDTLGFDNGHNYRRWQLVAAPTLFTTTTHKYVYVAIPRVKYDESNTPIRVDNPTALVVYPSEKIDIYGCNENGDQIGSTDNYYIFLQGIISASVDGNGDTQNRTWEQAIVTGTLASDEALAAGAEESVWFRYDSVTGTVTFLKTIVSATINTLTSITATITNLILGGTTLTGVYTADNENSAADAADKVVTPAYGKKAYLSRKNDDTAFGNITFNQDITMVGEIKSSDFVTGDIDGVGFKLGRYGSTTDSYLEVDQMLVRKRATFLELVVKKIRAIGGTFYLSPASADNVQLVERYTEDGVLTEDDSETAYYRVYWYAQDGSGNKTSNDFMADDLVRSQTFNVSEGTSTNVSNSYYWRQVINTPGTTDDGSYHYIDLSNRSGEKDAASLTAPAVGDDLVLCGNVSDVDRQNVIEISSYGSDAPRIIMYSGVDTFSFDNATCVANMSPTSVQFNSAFFQFVSGSSSQSGADVLNRLTALENDTTSGFEIFKGETAAYPCPYTDEDGTYHDGTEIEPSSEWTEAQRADYVGKAYYITIESIVFRWAQLADSTYYWEMVTDKYLINAIQQIAATKAFASLAQLSKLRSLVNGLEINSYAYSCIQNILQSEAEEYNNIILSSAPVAGIDVNVSALIETLETTYNAMVSKFSEYVTGAITLTSEQAAEIIEAIDDYINAKGDVYSGVSSSQVTFTAQQNSIANTFFTFDSENNASVSTSGGLLTSTQWATLYARAITGNSGATSETIASLTALVTQRSDGTWMSAVNIYGDEIRLNADHCINFTTGTVTISSTNCTLTADGTLTTNNMVATNVDISGKVTASSGYVGDFSILNGILNYGNAADFGVEDKYYVGFAKDGFWYSDWGVRGVAKYIARIGYNADDNSDGTQGSIAMFRRMHFQTESVSPAVWITTEVYTSDDISNYGSIALRTEGGMSLMDGIVDKGHVLTGSEFNLYYGTVFLVTNSGATAISRYMPTFSLLAEFFGTGTFAVKFTVVNSAKSSGIVRVFPSSSESYTLYDIGGSSISYLQVSRGQSAEIMMVYDGTNRFLQVINKTSVSS